MNVIILDSTSKSIVAKLAASATTQPDFVSSYADASNSAFTEGGNDGTLNSTTEVTLVAAPVSSTRRLVRELIVTNTNSAAVYLTVYLANGASRRTIWEGYLDIKETWSLTDGLIQAIPADGWTTANETWAYATASTITVPSGAASRYAKGDRVRFKQGGGYKYMAIIGIADTTLTVTGGSDYTVANATITDNDYSHAASPVGYPDWFNYAPTITWTASVNPSGTPTETYKFKIFGAACVVNLFAYGYTAGTGVTSARATLPVNATPANWVAAGACQNVNTQNLCYACTGSTLAYVFCNSVAAERFAFTCTYPY